MDSAPQNGGSPLLCSSIEQNRDELEKIRKLLYRSRQRLNYISELVSSPEYGLFSARRNEFEQNLGRLIVQILLIEIKFQSETGTELSRDLLSQVPAVKLSVKDVMGPYSSK